MDKEQKMLVRNMANTAGWKLVTTWAEKQIEADIGMLINENDEAIRGKIKGMKAFLKKVKDLSKK